MIPRVFFDRSRVEAYQRCPRSRLYGYELEGRGVAPAAGGGTSQWPLHFGSGFHRAGEKLLQGESLDVAIAEGQAVFIDNASPNGNDEREVAQADEAVNLLGGLIHAWSLVRLPEWKTAYNVLDVEREETAILPYADEVLVLMARCDALMERKADSHLFVVNFKTTKKAEKGWQEQWSFDQQILSETLAVEQRVGRKIDGVFVEGIIKGESVEYPEGSGQWQVNNPLAWTWHNETSKPHPRGEWSAKWKWQCDEPDCRDAGKGTHNHTLGKGWRKRPVWKDYNGGTKAWVEWLAANDPQVLHGLFVTIGPLLRGEWEIERWKRMTLPQELRIRSMRTRVAEQPEKVDELFPMHTGRHCSWCAFKPCCFGGIDDPLSSELYQLRVANHPQEVFSGTD